MTVEDWKKLGKPIIEAQPVNIEDTTPPQDSNVSVLPTDEEEANPFHFQDDATPVEAARDLITENNPMVAQVSNPKAFAYAEMKIKWMESIGATALAEADRTFIKALVSYECGRKGKENRAKLFAEVLKSQMNAEFQLQKSAGDKLMGR